MQVPPLNLICLTLKTSVAHFCMILLWKKMASAKGRKEARVAEKTAVTSAHVEVLVQ